MFSAMIDLGIVVLLVENLVYILVWLWLNVYWVWFWFSERFLRMVYESMIGFGWGGLGDGLEALISEVSVKCEGDGYAILFHYGE